MSQQTRQHNEILVRCYRNGVLHWRHPIDFGKQAFHDDGEIVDLVRTKLAVTPWFQIDVGDLLPTDRLEVIRPTEGA